jgi:hypothetical protein
MFAQDADQAQIAWSLRVSAKPVYQWHRAWPAVARRPLAPEGRAGDRVGWTRPQLANCAPRWRQGRRSRLGPGPALDPGPLRCAGGPPVRSLLHGCAGSGFSPHVPVHRAVEWDETAIAEWRVGGGLSQGTRLAAGPTRGLLRGRGGQSLRPEKARTAAPRGRTAALVTPAQ